MDKWENDVDFLQANQVKEALNKRGEDGWELVTVLTDQNSHLFALFFKRKPEPIPFSADPALSDLIWNTIITNHSPESESALEKYRSEHP